MVRNRNGGRTTSKYPSRRHVRSVRCKHNNYNFQRVKRHQSSPKARLLLLSMLLVFKCFGIVFSWSLLDGEPAFTVLKRRSKSVKRLMGTACRANIPGWLGITLSQKCISPARVLSFVRPPMPKAFWKTSRRVRYSGLITQPLVSTPPYFTSAATRKEISQQ